MHDGCTAAFDNGKEIINKIRMMGFNKNPLPAPLEIECTNCDQSFTMDLMETACPSCEMVYGVTPCHSHSSEFVRAAGVRY